MLIDQLLDNPYAKLVDLSAQTGSSAYNTHKSVTLTALAKGGLAMQYLGKASIAEQIDSMSDKEIEKLYARYNVRLGASMTKTIEQAVLQLYSGLLPISLGWLNQPKLVANLEDNAVLLVSYTTASTVALITAKYCRFEHTCSCTINGNFRESRSSSAVQQKTSPKGCCGSDRSCGQKGNAEKLLAGFREAKALIHGEVAESQVL